MKSGRKLAIAAIVMLVASVVQLGWWCYDQYRYTAAQQAATLKLLGEQAEAAKLLLAAGEPPERVTALFPSVELGADGPQPSATVVDTLVRARWHRINQYMWESAFLFVVLGAGIAVIWRALSSEVRILKEQDRFLALVSHQFKTPLASLQLSLETMQLRTLAPEHERELMNRMLTDISRMESMVTQILDSARLDQGRLDLRPEGVELQAAVGHVTAQLGPRAERERIAFETTIEPGLEAWVDAMTIDVVLRNVIENALQAVAPLGGGTVRIVGRRAGGQVELAIEDSGVGFDAADRERMFGKYARLDTGGAARQHGTGLGLYIVERLMRLAGGRVDASSEGLGRGARFVLSWPASQAQARPLAGEQPA